jgi:hypothetical protein
MQLKKGRFVVVTDMLGTLPTSRLMSVMYMDSSVHTSKFLIRLKARTYIRLFGGDAISQPSMYAHPGASMS